jgi:hypothetical protein
MGYNPKMCDLTLSNGLESYELLKKVFMLSSLCVWTIMVVGTNIITHNKKLETIN